MQMPDFDPVVAEALAQVMADIPGAKASKMFGMPGYKVNGKLAVGMFYDRVVAKVGAPRASDLIAGGSAQPFEPQPGRVWKDWVQFSGDLASHRDILEEAVQYVAENS